MTEKNILYIISNTVAVVHKYIGRFNEGYVSMAIGNLLEVVASSQEKLKAIETETDIKMVLIFFI